jgi:hypothetical protein
MAHQIRGDDFDELVESTMADLKDGPEFMGITKFSKLPLAERANRRSSGKRLNADNGISKVLKRAAIGGQPEIAFKGKRLHLRTFDTSEEAAKNRRSLGNSVGAGMRPRRRIELRASPCASEKWRQRWPNTIYTTMIFGGATMGSWRGGRITLPR